MDRSILLLGLLLAGACGGSDSTHYVMKGECVAPSAAVPVTIAWNEDIACSVAGAVVVSDVAGYNALCPQGTRDTLGADLPPIDFTQQELVAFNGTSTRLNFLVDDGTALHLGLVGIIAGYAMPNVGLAIPRTDHPLQVESCQTVCEGYCPPVP
ncbi:MAG TPA: hypothetical protein VGL86_18780 [Polyangia bacterium]